MGVVKVTYDSHLDMIPTLKEEEKSSNLCLADRGT